MGVLSYPCLLEESSFHSKVMTLLPRDIISKGTPGTVEVQDGDVVSCYKYWVEPLLNLVRRLGVDSGLKG